MKASFSRLLDHAHWANARTLAALQAGSGVRADLSAQEKATCWLYEEGYECYTQGVKNPAYFFVYPAPRPEAFEQR